MSTVLAAAIERAKQPSPWGHLDTYRTDLEQVGVTLTGAVAYTHRFTLVQVALDYVDVNVWPDNRRTDSYRGYLRQAFVRELTRET